jgi:peptidylprolyl isomerase domain and WD repeat-containing protein 1
MSNASLPNASRYFLSLMHREIITHTITCSRHNLIVTVSQDYNVKIWSWNSADTPPIKLARSYQLPLEGKSEIISLSIQSESESSFLIGTEQGSFFVFELPLCDLASSFSTQFAVRKAFLFSVRGRYFVAIAAKTNTTLCVLDAVDGSVVLHLDKLHRSLIMSLDWNSKGEFGISIDQAGMIEYWRLEDGKFPKGLSFFLKSETDLYHLAKKKIFAHSCAFSRDGMFFGCLCSDFSFCLWQVQSGKLVARFAEIEELDMQELVGKIKHSESEISIYSLLNQNILFTEDSVLFCTFSGICVFSLKTLTLASMIGYNEKIRFICIGLLKPSKQDEKFLTLERATSENPAFMHQTSQEYILVATGWNKSRFYLFSKGEPPATGGDLLVRDVQNERILKKDISTKFEQKIPIFKKAIIFTDVGEIRIQLFPALAPKTVENFGRLSQAGAYNGIFWHRIVHNCLIQGGKNESPSEVHSIWGKEFEDEFHSSLSFTEPFLLCMTNISDIPYSNQREFFITAIPAPWLEGKHTIFGRVIEGQEIVKKISLLPTDKNERPLHKCRISEIRIFEE